MILQMSPKAEFGLLAWLLAKPGRAHLGPFPAMLLLAKTHFREARAQWLAKEIIVRDGDSKAIYEDARMSGQMWFSGFQKEAQKEGFTKCPDELKEKLVKHFPHPEFDF